MNPSSPHAAARRDSAPSLRHRLLGQLRLITLCAFALATISVAQADDAATQRSKKPPRKPAVKDAKNTDTGLPDPPQDPALARFGIYEKTAPCAESTDPIVTALPLTLRPNDRIALIGNALLERSGQFGHLEAMIQQAFPDHQLTVRHLAWTADEIDLQPRPDNFADTLQHLNHEQVDVIFAA